MKAEKVSQKLAEQIGKFLIETYLDKRLDAFEKNINYRFEGLRSEFQGLRDKVDALNAKDELIRVLTDELKRRIGNGK